MQWFECAFGISFFFVYKSWWQCNDLIANLWYDHNFDYDAREEFTRKSNNAHWIRLSHDIPKPERNSSCQHRFQNRLICVNKCALAHICLMICFNVCNVCVVSHCTAAKWVSLGSNMGGVYTNVDGRSNYWNNFTRLHSILTICP